MIISLIAVILFVGLVGVSLLGGRLARHLPAEQLSADSKDAVKLAMGLIATMTAVLLGLLITSAKGTYDTEESEVMQMAAKVAFLDRVLKLTDRKQQTRAVSFATPSPTESGAHGQRSEAVQSG
jgi:hypothetical protein